MKPAYAPHPKDWLLGNGQNRSSFPTCTFSQTCKLQHPSARPSPQTCTNFFLAQVATNNTYLSLQPTTTYLKPSLASYQSLPASINAMAARTLEAGFQRMSIQDENAPGESGRVYQKTSKVSCSPIRSLSNRADCLDNRFFINTACTIHKPLESLQGCPPVPKHQHRRDCDASLPGCPAKSDCLFFYCHPPSISCQESRCIHHRHTPIAGGITQSTGTEQSSLTYQEG